MNVSADQLLLDTSVRVVSFDVGFTLIEPDPPVGVVYGRVAARMGFEFDPEWLTERFFAAWRKGLERVRSGEVASFNTSEAGAREWWDAIVRGTFGDAVPEEAMEELCRAEFEEYASGRCFRLREGVPEVLERLREKRSDVGLVVLSNWDKRLEQVLDEMGLSGYFDRIFYSSGIGYEKPDARSFEAVLRGMDISAGELVHVGDSREDDVEGASGVGARALLVRRSQESQSNIGEMDDTPLPCPVVDSPAEVLRGA